MIESNTTLGGRGRTLIMAYVIIPIVPSEPKMNSVISGPELVLGESCDFVIVPRAVTS